MLQWDARYRIRFKPPVHTLSTVDVSFTSWEFPASTKNLSIVDAGFRISSKDVLSREIPDRHGRRQCKWCNKCRRSAPIGNWLHILLSLQHETVHLEVRCGGVLQRSGRSDCVVFASNIFSRRNYIVATMSTGTLGRSHFASVYRWNSADPNSASSGSTSCVFSGREKKKSNWKHISLCVGAIWSDNRHSQKCGG